MTPTMPRPPAPAAIAPPGNCMPPRGPWPRRSSSPESSVPPLAPAHPAPRSSAQSNGRAAASARRHTLVPCPVPIPRARSPREARPGRRGPRAGRRRRRRAGRARVGARVRDRRRRPCPAARPCARSGPLVDEGADPLGEAFCRLRSPERRRPDGATYTPPADRRVDGRLGRRTAPRRHGSSTRARGRDASRWPPGGASRGRRVVAVERDPWRPSCCRGHLAGGRARRPRPRGGRRLPRARPGGLGRRRGRTLYLGNPPYVRHHQIPPGLEGVAHAHGARARAGGEPARRAARPLLPRHRGSRARPGDAAPSSPRRSGSTPTTGASCASCCSGRWAARRSTSWSPPRRRSRTRP